LTRIRQRDIVSTKGKREGQMAENKLMTPEELAAFLRIHLNTVYNLIADGKIPATKVGSHLRISKKWVEEQYGPVD
jgi:excisionase family DNA binding protein